MGKILLFLIVRNPISPRPRVILSYDGITDYIERGRK